MKKIVRVSVLFLLMLLLAGCSKGDGEKVYVYNWGNTLTKRLWSFSKKKQVLRLFAKNSNKTRICIRRFSPAP